MTDILSDLGKMLTGTTPTRRRKRSRKITKSDRNKAARNGMVIVRRSTLNRMRRSGSVSRRRKTRRRY